MHNAASLRALKITHNAFSEADLLAGTKVCDRGLLAYIAAVHNGSRRRGAFAAGSQLNSMLAVTPRLA
jgi:hypothetical protein